VRTRLSPAHLRQLEALRKAYAREVPGKVRAIREAGAALPLRGWEREALDQVFVLAHRLSGSAAIFGFEPLRQAALALEDLLLQVKELPQPTVAWEGRLATLLKGLTAALPAPPVRKARAGRRRSPARPKRRPRPRSRSAR
jgi:HPt (histidine-containing phosphotransfer) domain-containing protein